MFTNRPVDRLLHTSEVLLLIIDYIPSIETFLSFRHTSHHILSLTDTYAKSIALSFAHYVFPNCHRLLSLEQPCPHTIQWLIDLIPRQLAAILVDRHREVWDTHMYGIPAEEPTGDALRARVANGFRVLRKLSIIAQRIHTIAPPAPPSRLRSLSEMSLEKRDALTRLRNISLRTPPDVVVTKTIEALILERRLTYVRSLSVRDREDYQILSLFLVGAFEHLWGGPMAFSVTADDGPLDFGRPPRKWIGRKDSWANWYIMSKGPMLFYQQWWGSTKTSWGGRSLFIVMADEYLARNEKVVKVEREAAEKIEKELLRGLDHDRYDPPPELGFWEYERLSVQDDRAQREYARKDTLGCVPFRVDENRESHVCTHACPNMWREDTG